MITSELPALSTVSPRESLPSRMMSSGGFAGFGGLGTRHERRWRLCGERALRRCIDPGIRAVDLRGEPPVRAAEDRGHHNDEGAQDGKGDKKPSLRFRARHESAIPLQIIDRYPVVLSRPPLSGIVPVCHHSTRRRCGTSD